MSRNHNRMLCPALPSRQPRRHAVLTSCAATTALFIGSTVVTLAAVFGLHALGIGGTP